MTNYKKEIEDVLTDLKKIGHNRSMIEEKLGYSVNAIDQSLARGGSKKLLRVVELYKEWVLKNSTPNSLPLDHSPEPDLRQLLKGQAELRGILERIESKIDRLPSAVAGTPMDELKRDLLRKDKAVGKGK